VDRIETIEGSRIQHGHHNGRIYIMHLKPERSGKLIARLNQMAFEKGYGKIFAKIPAPVWKNFQSAGYIQEAFVPGFFKGKIAGLFVAKFFSPGRQKIEHPQNHRHIKKISQDVPGVDETALPIIACTPSDAEALGSLYGSVFESYPFPIHQPAYLKEVMKAEAYYFGINIENRIAAAAAVEIDTAAKVCEMTDFATLPEHRRKGLAGKLLEQLEKKALKHQVMTAFTIARADSPGMNRVFEQAGYQYAGRLNKNSQIGGRIRSMFVWYKRLA
jgi:putative beta-lysine N-acetyltransferase